jgi:hypothetical protein
MGVDTTFNIGSAARELLKGFLGDPSAFKLLAEPTLELLAAPGRRVSTTRPLGITNDNPFRLPADLLNVCWLAGLLNVRWLWLRSAADVFGRAFVNDVFGLVVV